MSKPFDLRIQHGITGGFAPPRPSAVHDLHFEHGAPVITLTSLTRDDGTPSLQPQGLKAIHPSSHDTEALISELESILRTLPTEQVPSTDIYGRDIGIMYQCGDFTWVNSAPEGCGRSESEISVNEEQRQAFGRAVEIVQTLVDRGVAHEG